jgi:hypothetical protein
MNGDDVPRRARWFVGAILTLLLVPGLVGFDLWPLTGWRLYSRSYAQTRIDWHVVAVTPRGEIDVAWTDLPLGDRLGAWPIEDLPGASESHRREVCRALLDDVRGVDPDATAIALVRDERSLLADAPVTVERERLVTCG